MNGMAAAPENNNQKIEIKGDERGKAAEVFKFPGVGLVFYSTTKPGKTRGNHYHLRKKEYFCVIEGEGKIALRNLKTDKIKEYEVSGDEPEIVEMPVGWTHNIRNTGKGEMKLLIWADEIYNPQDPDTYQEIV